MSAEFANQGTENKRYKPKKMAIIGMGLLFFLILGAIALVLCNFRTQYATQNILNQQRDVQQTWMQKSLDAIRAWRNELMDQSRFISSSEMFRLFVIDAKELPNDLRDSLADPDTMHSEDDSLRTMAEHYTYIQDLLTDFTRRRAWTNARILLPDGYVMVAPEFSPPVTEEQKNLAQKAAAGGEAIFGPIRQTDKGLVMDMADPLFDVLGASSPTVVAVLLLSVPVEKPLATFLARNGEQTETMLPRIVNDEKGTLFMAFAQGSRISLEPVSEDSLSRMENLSFARRKSLDGKSEVYSMGGMPLILHWLYVLETPAAEVDGLIHSQKVQIYGLGILSSIGVALLAAWLWAGHTSRRHEADAIRYEKLYNTIRNQKMMLDSINASFGAGMLLVDVFGRVQMNNPAFREIFGDRDIAQNTPLTETMPSKTALKLLEDMSRVNEMGKSATVEIELEAPKKESAGAKCLYRVTLYPYSEEIEGQKKPAGCVAIFQDITEFRKKAEINRKRQQALLSAFVRAIESVDPNLVGHSRKMVDISRLLSDKLDFDEARKETLRLSAALSQVGKIYVPRELLTKKGKLTPEELQEIRKAPEYADRILKDLHFDLPVRETVGLISERVNGTGSPRGLSGAQISPCGRALEVVNAFIAMTSSRAWRGDKGMSIDDAITTLQSDQGFDQNVVAALAKIPHEEVQKIIDAQAAPTGVNA